MLFAPNPIGRIRSPQPNVRAYLIENKERTSMGPGAGIHMDQNELRPVAQMLLRHFGKDAKSLAAKRAKELFDHGSQEGGLPWVQIVRAIDGTSRVSTRQSSADT
jgi:hypothetical protein